MQTRILTILLKPFAAFCVRHSVKLQELNEVLKEQLVIAAKQELLKKSEKATASRLSLMTGVHRKDLKKILEGDLEQFYSKQNIISKIIGTWQEDRKFLTKKGKPRVLTVEGAKSEFANLVSSVSSDFNPYTVLFELERMDLVKKTTSGVSLQANFYQPAENLEASYNLLANDLNDIIFAVEENINQNSEIKNLHLKTEYDKIAVEYTDSIKDWLLKEGTKFQKKVQTYLSKFDSDINPKVKSSSGKYSRIALGSYSYSEISDEN